MSNYTYKLDSKLFLQYLIRFIEEKDKKTQEEEKIISLLKDSRCVIEHSVPNYPNEPHWSNAILLRNSYLQQLEFYKGYKSKSVKLGATIYFLIPNNPKIYKKTQIKLIEICNHIMPPDTGFKINKVETKPFFPETNKESFNKTHFRELIKYINSNEFEISSENKYLDIKNFPDEFYEELASLINKCYLLGIYESVQIFSRKLLENLLVDILRKKFNMKNIDLFFNINSGRFHGFSTLLDNFKDNLDEFKPYSGALNHDFLEKIRKFKLSGDSSAHTLELNVKEENLDKNGDLEYIVRHLVSIYEKI